MFEIIGIGLCGALLFTWSIALLSDIDAICDRVDAAMWLILACLTSGGWNLFISAVLGGNS